MAEYARERHGGITPCPLGEPPQGSNFRRARDCIGLSVEVERNNISSGVLVPQGNWTQKFPSYAIPDNPPNRGPDRNREQIHRGGMRVEGNNKAMGWNMSSCLQHPRLFFPATLTVDFKGQRADQRLPEKNTHNFKRRMGSEVCR